LSLNYYSYVYNNPLKYNDPSGNIPVETIFDAASFGFSLNAMINNPGWLNAGFLAWDTAALIVPYAPGSWIARLGKGLYTAVDNAQVVKSGIDGLWKMGGAKRGHLIDTLLGNNLGSSFPVADKLKNRTLTSIKSHDLTSKSMQGNVNSIKKEINTLAKFTQRSYNGVEVKIGQYDLKELELAFNRVNMTAEQEAAMVKVFGYLDEINKAQSVKIVIKITYVD
jgi:hypothetical protein